MAWLVLLISYSSRSRWADWMVVHMTFKIVFSRMKLCRNFWKYLEVSMFQFSTKMFDKIKPITKFLDVPIYWKRSGHAFQVSLSVIVYFLSFNWDCQRSVKDSSSLLKVGLTKKFIYSYCEFVIYFHLYFMYSSYRFK